MNKNLNIIIILFLLLILPINIYSQSLSIDNIPALGQNDDSYSLLEESFKENEASLNNIETIKEIFNIIEDDINKFTPLEKEYSLRSNQKLTLKGYDFFKSSIFARNLRKPSYSGFLQEDYILGIGDELTLVLQGQKDGVVKRTIDNNGLLLFDFSSPISAAGRLLSEVKKEILQRVNDSFIETEVYISISEFKQLSIMVTGEVFLPGTKNMFSLSSIMDALVESGGIKKGGSLRNIKLVRKNKITNIDLYELIFGFKKSYKFNEFLQNGDIIFVPYIEDTIALVGNFLNPGIYELSSNTNLQTDIFRYAGGFSTLGSKSKFIKSFNDDEVETFEPLTEKRSLQNGDIIFSSVDKKLSKNHFEIRGAVKKHLTIPLELSGSIGSILKENILIDDAYNYSGILKSKNEMKTSYKVFNIQNVINNKTKLKIKEEDTIFIFLKSDIEFFSSKTVIDQIYFNKSKNIYQDRCVVLDFVNRYISGGGETLSNSYFSIFNDFKGIEIKSNKIVESPNQIFIDSAQSIQVQPEKKPSLDSLVGLDGETDEETLLPCPKVFENEQELVVSFLENIIYLKGNVSNPGIHLHKKNSDIKELLFFAGYEKGNIIISPDNMIVEVSKPFVTLRGSVRFPSKIFINNNSKISKILNTSNQLNYDAYPIFATIKRKNKNLGGFYYLSFNPEAILTNKIDISLQDQDEIFIFSKNKIDNLINDFNKNAISRKNNTKQTQNLKENNNNFYENLESNNDNLSNIEIGFVTENNLEKFEELYTNNNNFYNDNISSMEPNQRYIKNQNNNIISSTTQKEKIEKSHSSTFDKSLSDFILNNLAKISGEVLRPGFYPVSNAVELESLILVAGGPTLFANLDRIEISSQNKNSNFQRYVYPGNKVFVPNNNSERKEIKISGSVNQERVFKGDNIYVSNLIKSKDDLRDDAYLYFSTIERQPKESFEKIFFAFSPYEIINKRQDFELFPGDKIKIYSIDEVNELVKENKNNKLTPDLSLAKFSDIPEKTGSVKELVNRLTIEVEGPLVNSSTILSGSVITIESIINISGGFTNNADRETLTISFPDKDTVGRTVLKTKEVLLNKDNIENTKVLPGSLLRFNQFPSDFDLGNAVILGAVNQPGSYRVNNDTSIFDLLKLAGGLKDNAYLEGLVFTREEEKIREEKSISRLGRELDKSLISAFESQSAANKSDPSILIPLRDLAKRAQNYETIGRVVGEFNSINTLKKTIITGGDRIFIPKKPTSITVIGEVMTPGSILWDERFDFSSYIESAAGFSDLADKRKVFVILPNGKAKRISGLWTNSFRILPGSTIFIPRKIQLATSLEKLSAITSIVYQLTLSIAGIDNVLNN